MNLNERHTQILNILHNQGSVMVTDLAEKLAVSSVTIRKDLTYLEEQKLLYRTHGKAILIDPYINNRHVSEKEKLFMEEKRLIGIEATKLIKPNDSILIASGTTMHAFARHINPKENLTVITSALTVSSILSKNKRIDVIQLGGFLRNSSVSTVGDYAIQMLNDFSCSKLFMGVDGLDLDYGITTTNAMEALLNRAMIEISQKVIVLTDSSKFDKRGFSKICDNDHVDQVITDDKIPRKILEGLKEQGIEVTVVGNKHHDLIV